MTDIPAIQKEIKLLEAMQKVKESPIKNSKEVGKLNEEGKVLDEEDRKLKLRIDEHCCLVEGVKKEGRRLEEEEKGLQVELDLLNRPSLIVSISQPSTTPESQVIVAERLTPVFPPEVFMYIAPYLPAKDQLSLRSLNKKIRSAIPKVLRLNIRYLKESFDRLMNGFKEIMLIPEIPIHFTLDPKEVEMNPYGVFELALGILDEWYPYNNNYPAIHALLGPSLKVVVPKVLRRSHKHPKFKLLDLDMAAFANCPEAIQFLLSSRESTAIPGFLFKRAFLVAVRGGIDDVVKILLQDPRTDPACCGNLPIRLAAQEGHTSTVQLLLQDPRVSPEALDNIAISVAAERGHVGVVKLLLADARVDWKAQNFRALRSAHQHGHCETSKILLDHFVAHPGERERD